MEYPLLREARVALLRGRITSSAYPKIPVTARALIQRLNRRLLRDDLKLRKSRGAKALHDLGEYYILDISRNVLISTDVDIEHEAREWGCFEDCEVLVDDG